MPIGISEFIIFLAGVCNTLIASFVFTRQPRNTIHRSFFVTILGISVWSAGFALLPFISSPLLFTQIILLSGIVWVFSLFVFTQYFPKSQGVSGKAWILTLIPFVVTAISIMLNLVITDIDFSSGVEPVNGPLFPVLALFVISYIIMSFYSMIRSYIKAYGSEKTRIAYFFLGMSIFILVTLICDVLLPAFNITSLNSLGPLSSIILVATTAYAILRHQLMDIRVVIQRGLIYMFLLAMIVSCYLALLTFFHSGILALANDQAALFSGVVISIIGIFTVPLIDRFLRRVTNALFFKEKYNYSEALYELSKTLHEVLYLEDLLVQTGKGLEHIFHTSGCSYITSQSPYVSAFQKHAYSSDDFRSLYFPIIYKNSLVATLVMQTKKSGDRYTGQDIHLLETFAYQMAVAFEKARLLKQVQDYSQDLEAKVAKRTEAIVELQQAQEQMMLDISHNLQTPLTVIKNEIALLGAESSLSGKESLFLFEESIDRVSLFITRLLSIARTDSLDQDTTQDIFNLSQCCEEVLEYSRLVAESEDVIFTTALEEDVYIKGNRKEIEELLTNILSNAMKYRKKTIPSEISVRLIAQGKRVYLYVKDNGIGIPKKDLNYVCERFYRNKNTKISGTGLGLAICKKIVQKHFGNISLESEHGMWTEVCVELPLV